MGGQQIRVNTYTFSDANKDEIACDDNKNDTDQTADLSIGCGLSC